MRTRAGLAEPCFEIAQTTSGRHPPLCRELPDRNLALFLTRFVAIDYPVGYARAYWPIWGSSMKYCSNCGQSISRRWIATDRAERYLCSSCGTIHYQNPRVIVACIAFWRDKILMCRRAEEPAIGKWVLPSGFLECGETLQEGVARETLEETGIVVEPHELELYSVVNMTAIQQIIVAFRVELATEPHLRAGPECMEVALHAEDSVTDLDLAWSKSMGNSIQRLFEEVRTGTFGIHVVTKGSEQGEGFRAREYRILAGNTFE